MFNRHALLIAALPLAAVMATFAASEQSTPALDLESALLEVLVHNDLADIDFLSKTLGIGFRVTAPVPAPYWFGTDDDRHVRVMATSNPPSMLAQGLSYTSEMNGRHETPFELHFIPRDRPNITKWAADWKLRVTASMATEAAGSSEAIQFGGPAGIELSAFLSTSGWYDVTLRQVRAPSEPFSSHIEMDLVPATTLVRQLGALIAEGDLRHYDQTAEILRTTLNVDPRSTRDGRWYYGNAQLDSVIAGIDPKTFSYRVDEFGWVRPPAFFVMPAHLSQRTVDLELTVDVYQVCLSPKDIEAELKRRSIHYTLESRDSDELAYTVIGKNKITLWAGRFRNCINQLKLSQITDVDHSYVTPILFSVSKSVDKSSEKLNDAAIKRVNWVVANAAAVPLGGIDIIQFQGRVASESQRTGAIRLAQLLRDAFDDRGIQSNLLKIETGLVSDKQATDGTYVTVDAYTK
jgi:hypothetical protein